MGRTIKGIATILFVLATLFSSPTAGQSKVEIVEYTASWCGSCQTMKPVVNELRRNGYPIRVIDFDTNREAAAADHVETLPAFVLKINGVPRNMLSGTQTGQSLTDLILHGRAALSTVRTTSIANGNNHWGSGVVVCASGGTATIAATNHTLYPGGTVRVWSYETGRTYPAKVIARNAAEDVALLQIILAPGERMTAARLSTESVRKGDVVSSAGYPKGGRVEVKARIGITSENATVSENGVPVGSPKFSTDTREASGRSGGPIYNATGKVLGLIHGTDQFGSVACKSRHIVDLMHGQRPYALTSAQVGQPQECRFHAQGCPCPVHGPAPTLQGRNRTVIRRREGVISVAPPAAAGAQFSSPTPGATNAVPYSPLPTTIERPVVQQTVIDPNVVRQSTEQSVADYFARNPVRNGIDGAQGKQGETGPAGTSVTVDDVLPTLVSSLPVVVDEFLKRNPPQRGEKGDTGAAGPAATAEQIRDAVIAFQRERPELFKGDTGETGPRGFVGVPDEQDIRNWLVGASSDPATRTALASLLGELPEVQALIRRVDALEQRQAVTRPAETAPAVAAKFASFESDIAAIRERMQAVEGEQAAPVGLQILGNSSQIIGRARLKKKGRAVTLETLKPDGTVSDSQLYRDGVVKLDFRKSK